MVLYVTLDAFQIRFSDTYQGPVGRQSETAGRKGRVALACKRCKRRKQRVSQPYTLPRGSTYTIS